MKKTIVCSSVCIALIEIICLCLFNLLGNKAYYSYAQSPQWSESARLHISGSKIYSSNNKQVLLRGFGSAGCEFIDSKWNTWYNDKSLLTIKGLGANTMRLMTEVSFYHDEKNSYAEKYCEYVDRCINNNLYVIVSWMGNEDLVTRQQDAISFFDYMTTRYGDCPYIIYEIANEPKNCTWTQIRNYSCSVIPAIRQKAPSSLIVVPSGLGFGGVKTNQDIISNPLPYANIIYQEHLYVGASFNSGCLTETSSLVNAGYPVIFTEWGTTDANGRDNYYEDYSLAFLKYCDMHDINWCYFQLSDFIVKKGGPLYESSTCINGKWSDSLSDGSLTRGGKLIKRYFKNHNVKSTNSVMMNYTEGYAFWNDSVRDKVTNIFFVKDNNFNKSFSSSWDVSMCSGSGDVMAYLCGTDLYIVARRGRVLAPRSNDYVFYSFTQLTSLSLNNYDTSYSNYTNALFAGCKSLESIDLSNYNTMNLTTFSSEFLNCNSLKEIDLSKCDLNNVTFYENAFRNCYSLEKLTLPRMKAENILNGPGILANAGNNTSGLSIYMDGQLIKTIK